MNPRKQKRLQEEMIIMNDLLAEFDKSHQEKSIYDRNIRKEDNTNGKRKS